MLKDKIKSIFKLSNWKRWIILIFSLIFVGLFIGLSLGLKTKDTKYSNDYKNGITFVVSPKVNGNDLEESESKKYLSEFESMLKNDYPDSYINSSYEKDNVWEIKATNIEQKSLIESIKKQPITLMPIEATLNTDLYQSSFSNNSLFNYVSMQGENVLLYSNSSNLNNFWQYANSAVNDSKKIIIWKNFEILRNKVKQEVEQNSYSGTIYEYLWVDGWTPEKEENRTENDTTRPPLLKDEIEIDGKIYKPSDFLLSKNDISSYSASNPSNTSRSITIDRSCLNNIKPSNNKDLFYDLSFWISPYSLDDSIIAPMYATNGSHAYTFLIIALVSFFSIISIYVVINYGYLGILAIILLAIFIFLSLLMISVFFGDYDSITIASLVFSTIIVLDFIFVFLDNIKKNVLKGNNLDKAVKNTSKKLLRTSFFRSFILILFAGLSYITLSSIFGNFSLLILITLIMIPIILIPLLFSLSRTLVGIKRMENNTKLIGLWTKKYSNVIIENSNSILEDDNKLEETFEIDPNKRFDDIRELLRETNNFDIKLKKQKNHYIFNDIFKKWFKWIMITLFSFVIIVGLTTFLISFFNHGHSSFTDGLKISNYDNNNYFIRIAKSTGLFTNGEINNIESILSKYSNVLDIKSIDNSMIQVVLKNNFESTNINQIISQISNNFNTIIIPSKLIETSTIDVISKMSLGTFFGLIVTVLFIFLWTNWTFALSFFITFVSSLILFIFMLGFNWIEINTSISIVLICSSIILILNSTSLISNVYNQIKTKRIEVITKEEIETIVIKQSFKSLNSSLRISIVALLTFVLFSIMYGSLPLEFTLFMIGSIIVNTILSSLLLPKLIIKFETIRARIKRKVILSNYWDTEKIKEQTFKGINNLK